ncbi:MAG: hypothetical protein H7328_10380 [Bdellovibrio sp.]|nr:hypothetical protein [Bdellovibrio sp.]
MKKFNFIIVLFLLVSCASLDKKYSQTERPSRKVADIDVANLTPTEKATYNLISYLKKTNYFDFIGSQIHGWPKNDNSKSFWWGTYWSGVRIFKKDGRVTFLHPHDGSDNNGFRTAGLMIGMCYAQALSPHAEWNYQIQKMVRGFSSWILASDSLSRPDRAKVLSRAHYTENVTVKEPKYEYLVDYSLNRPGTDNQSTQYVEISDNPTFGHIWLKNSRSLDDIGEMILAMVQLNSCRSQLSAETNADIDQMNSLYSKWSVDVEDNKFQFPSLTKQGEYTRSNAPLTLITRKFLPTGLVAISLLHGVDDHTESLLTNLDLITVSLLGKKLNNDAIEMIRAANIAALLEAKTLKSDRLVSKLTSRVQIRIDQDSKILNDLKSWPRINKADIAGAFIHAHNAGVNISQEQINHIYKSLADADETTPSGDPKYNIFSSTVPDGEYGYGLTETSLIPARSVAQLIGTCSSKFRDSRQESLLNCDVLNKFLTEVH